MMRSSLLIFCLLFITFIPFGSSFNKYSKEANQPDTVQEKKDAWKDEENPFRLAKINLVWAKAKKRLTDFKLKKLYSELKVQDKEELQLKRLKADNLDKDSMKEADVRKKFGVIIERYGLGDGYDKEAPNNDLNKDTNTQHSTNIFKDKKLNKLWMKAETAGFTEAELKMLKDEFIHHQDKVLQFYNLLEEHNSRKIREDNGFVNEVHIQDLQDLEEKNIDVLKNSAHEGVRDTHRDLKDGYDRLERMTLSGPKSKEFDEPKVQGLWKMVLKSDFSQDEIESLRTELRHYEQRLQKLRYLQAQHNIQKLKQETESEKYPISLEENDDLRQRIKLQQRKVEKLQADLEIRITQRHLEL